LQEMFRRHVAGVFAVSANGRDCTPVGGARSMAAPSGRVAAEVAFKCPAVVLGAGQVSLSSRLFLDVAPSHLHFASVSNAANAEAEAILTDSRRRADLVLQDEAALGSAWASLARFIPVGAEHVWGGLDHLAFILALALLARRPATIVIAATGFTLGHTATLGLAAFGVFKPDEPTVEALIGFTVAFVALEAAGDGDGRMARWSSPVALVLLALAACSLIAKWPVSPVALAGLALFTFAYPRGFGRGASVAPWLAAGFGLIHGCGFAGALGELDLPRPHLLSALAGFNVGVELAQIGVIAAGVGLAWAADRALGSKISIARDAVAAGLFGVGVFWFASRTIGL
jgi:HupE / UreJ protein